MTRPRNYRVFSLLGILLVAALVLLAFEHRTSFLRPGLRLNAYIPTADGNLTVVDLVKLGAVAHVPSAKNYLASANIPRAQKSGESAPRKVLCGFLTRAQINS